MSDTNCPYCDADINIKHDDGYGYEENELHNQECRKCKRVFAYTTEVTFVYVTFKVDCLNGGEHKYKLTNTIPAEFSRMVCTECGEDK